MNSKVNPALIGLFVIGAVIIVIGAVAALGGGELFKEKLNYVMYFEGSVEGLRVGSPVTFRGVKVGSVSSIRVTVSDNNEGIRIPVHIELDPESVTGQSGFQGNLQARALVQRLVNKGLRGQLRVQSLITGQLSIMLDFHPEKPARYLGSRTGVRELPTIPSSLERITRSIEQLPFDEILNRVLRITEGLETIVHDPDLRGGVKSLNASLTEMRDLIAALNSHIDPLAEQLRKNSESLNQLLRNVDTQVTPLAQSIRKTAAETEALAANLNARIDALTPALTRTGEAATAALRQAEATMAMEKGPLAELARSLTEASAAITATVADIRNALAALRQATGEGSAVRYEATRALTEISAAAQALRSTAELIQRHPEALIRGKPAAGDE